METFPIEQTKSKVHVIRTLTGNTLGIISAIQLSCIELEIGQEKIFYIAKDVFKESVLFIEDASLILFIEPNISGGVYITACKQE